MYACKEHDGRHERSPTRYCCRGAQELLEYGPHENAETHEGREESHVETDLERRGTESGNAVEGEPHHLFERVLGRARGAFGAVVLDANLLEAYPAHEPAQKAAAFRQVLELVHHAAVHEAVVAGIGRDIDARELADEAVEAERGRVLEQFFIR